LHLIAGRGLDAAGIVGLDEVATDVESRWPGLFPPTRHASDVLYEMLIDGVPPPLSKEASLAQAAELLGHNSPDVETEPMLNKRGRPRKKAPPPQWQMDEKMALHVGLEIGRLLGAMRRSVSRSEIARVVIWELLDLLRTAPPPVSTKRRGSALKAAADAVDTAADGVEDADDAIPA
jgi:hypothetical protein